MKKYLGQTPPGLTAELFYGGELVEHEKGERRSFNIAFSPDGKEMFFSYYKGTKEKPHPEYEIKTFKLINNKWVGPETASFSGIFSDVDIKRTDQLKAEIKDLSNEIYQAKEHFTSLDLKLPRFYYF